MFMQAAVFLMQIKLKNSAKR